MMATTRVSDCLERTILPALFSRVVACRLDSLTPLCGLPTRNYENHGAPLTPQAALRHSRGDQRRCRLFHDELERG